MVLATGPALASAPAPVSDVSDNVFIVAPVLHFILISFRKRGACRVIFYSPVFGFYDYDHGTAPALPLLILFVHHHAARPRTQIEV